jgi:hypothetical protein
LEESILELYAFILLAVSWEFIRKKPAQVQGDRQKLTSDQHRYMVRRNGGLTKYHRATIIIKPVATTALLIGIKVDASRLSRGFLDQ